ncbi:MAG: flagellin FliC [Betaproteobacteria bacterium]|jgi:flagellin|nr:flagellin FliC [Betaproteobacteria bacterium]
MASVLNTNMSSISAQKYLGAAQNKLQVSFERLSSGSRINRAQDDAAGMGISQKLTASINSTSVAMRNANDAIGVLQTAEGALSEISNMLQRFKELSVQGGNPALSTSQRGFLSLEMDGLKSEIEAISERTRFNGTSLLGNSAGDGAAPENLVFQTGEGTTDTLTVATLNVIQGAAIEDLFSDPFVNEDGNGAITATEDFQELASKIDAAIDEVASARAVFGAQVNRLNYNLANLSALYENLSSANSRVVDTDYANETAQLTKTQILQQAATAMLSQANAQPNVILALLK